MSNDKVTKAIEAVEKPALVTWLELTLAALYWDSENNVWDVDKEWDSDTLCHIVDLIPADVLKAIEGMSPNKIPA